MGNKLLVLEAGTRSDLDNCKCGPNSLLTRATNTKTFLRPMIVYKRIVAPIEAYWYHTTCIMPTWSLGSTDRDNSECHKAIGVQMECSDMTLA